MNYWVRRRGTFAWQCDAAGGLVLLLGGYRYGNCQRLWSAQPSPATVQFPSTTASMGGHQTTLPVFRS